MAPTQCVMTVLFPSVPNVLIIAIGYWESPSQGFRHENTQLARLRTAAHTDPSISTWRLVSKR
jgi:hypothetical protein